MSTKTKSVIVINGELLTIAKKVGAAIKSADKLAITLGTLAREASAHITSEALLTAFISECRKACKGAAESSIKTYLSMVRGVLRAVVDGWEMPAERSIKSLYKAAPKGKGANSGGPGKPRTVAQEKRDNAPKTKTISIEDAARIIFGHADDELVAALEWARQNELAFIRYVKANLAAAAAAATTTAVTKPVTKLRRKAA